MPPRPKAATAWSARKRLSASAVVPAIVTLTTDFGLRDPYVAAMKGVLRTGCAALQIDDLSHDLPPQDIAAASRFLADALPWYPPGTLHLAVIDPGVGTARHPLALRAAGRFLLGPDNGIFGLILQHWPLEEARRIEHPAVLRSPVSPTFHGRDVFAPAAAALAAGLPFEMLGPPVSALTALPLPHTESQPDGSIRGQVVHVDHFGNCITNIPLPADSGSAEGTVWVGQDLCLHMHRTYGEVLPGAPLALRSSGGMLELAVREGSAAVVLGIQPGVALVYRPAS
jgi:S-adenosylmethionine hydrolase